MNLLLLKKITGSLLSVLLGAVFIYSGYTKLFPVIETFEFTFVEIGIGNWYTAPVLARLIIGLEFFLGLLLILNFDLKKFTLPFTIALLAFFILYLSIQIMISGNNGNCGCFGEHHKMTPLTAIVKNIIMIAMCMIVYFFQKGWSTSYKKLFLAFFFITSIVVPMVINPIDYSYTSNNNDEEVNYKLELELLYQPEDTSKVQVPAFDLRQGKKVVAFMSLSCAHCRIAGKKFRLIHKNNPELPIYFIFNGEKSKLKAFHDDTKSDSIPYSFCNGKSFVQLAGTQLPRIYYLDNGMLVKKVDYYELNQYHIEEWINSGKLD